MQNLSITDLQLWCNCFIGVRGKQSAS